jgi:hypothetical protein
MGGARGSILKDIGASHFPVAFRLLIVRESRNRDMCGRA